MHTRARGGFLVYVALLIGGARRSVGPSEQQQHGINCPNCTMAGRRALSAFRIHHRILDVRPVRGTSETSPGAGAWAGPRVYAGVAGIRGSRCGRARATGLPGDSCRCAFANPLDPLGIFSWKKRLTKIFFPPKRNGFGAPPTSRASRRTTTPWSALLVASCSWQARSFDRQARGRCVHRRLSRRDGRLLTIGIADSP